MVEGQDFAVKGLLCALAHHCRGWASQTWRLGDRGGHARRCTWECKINCFRTVKAVRESTVVCLGEGNDEFPRILECPDHLHTALSKLRRADHSAELEE
jgi:hypothetical protein